MAVTDSARAREEFDVFRQRTYLNWAALSPAPNRSTRAIAEMAAQAASFKTGDLNSVWYELSKGLADEAGKMLNAPADEIAVCGSSTTQGMQIALDAIEPGKGDNVVTSDMEFPSTGAELRKWKERGTEVRIARSVGGSYDAEDVCGLMDGRTKAVVLSSVSWVNGFRPDIETISRAAHENGSYLVIDAVQHMGAMKFDVQRMQPDFAAAGGQKWMTSPFGTAIMYVSRRALEELKPPHYSLNNSVEPEGGWSSYFADEDKTGFEEMEPVGGARKMEYGGWQNHLGMVSLKESLSLINSVGTSSVHERIRHLSRLLREELEMLGADIISPAGEENASSITTFRLAEGADHLKTVEKLAEKGVDVSSRGGGGIGGIRVSIHHMNNEDDIARLIEVLKGTMGRG